MSIEIDLYAERLVDGRWVLAEPWVPNSWLLPEFRDLLDDDEPVLDWPEVPRKLVAYGHSGVWTVLWGNRQSDRYRHVPIVAPRGRPDDLSDELAAYVELFGDLTLSAFGDGVGWYSLDELLAHDWDQVELWRPYISVKPFWTKRHWRWPTPWPWRRWEVVPHRELVGGLFMDALERLREIDDPSRIRVVFWVGD